MTKVPPKNARPTGRKPVGKARSVRGTKRVAELEEGEVDDDRMGRDDTEREALRESQASTYMDQEAYGDPREQLKDAQEQAKAQQRKTQQKTEKDSAKEQPQTKKTLGKAPAKLNKVPVTDGLKQLETLRESAAKLDKVANISPKPVVPHGAPGSAFAFLHNAKGPGEFFREHGVDGEGGGHGGSGTEETPPDPELLAAIEELILLLHEVPGIRRVSPGEDDEKNPVAVVVAMKGFTQASMRKVPEMARIFQVLMAIPYDLLPLKRELPLLPT